MLERTRIALLGGLSLLIAFGLGASCDDKGRNAVPQPADAAGPIATGPEGPAMTPQPEPPAPPLPLVKWVGKEPEGWAEVEKLVGEQKFEQASKRIEDLLEGAKSSKDSEAWTRTLIRWVQLRIGLHGYETAVRFLKEQPWPEDLLARTALNLFYGASLTTYGRTYSWEIQRREKVESSQAVDLKAWTMQQIYGEALRAYLEVWKQREQLSEIEPGMLGNFLALGNYPKEVRSSLRDTVTHLLVDLLADTQGWRPEQSNEVFALPLDRLLGGDLSATRLSDPAVHPLEKICAVLDDLERFHAGKGAREAAFDARLTRLERLHGSFTQAADRARIKKDLEERLPAMRDKPWWAMGMALLANFVQAEDRPEALVDAHRIAREGADAYPDSLGGQRCAHAAASIEMPAFNIEGMAADLPGKRSIGINAKNLPEVFFRAYRMDLYKHIATSDDYQLLPNYREIAALMSRKADYEWSTPLPQTQDFRMHHTQIVPPITRKGLYVIVASGRKKFEKTDNQLTALHHVVSDLALTTRQDENWAQVTVFEGASGLPAPGAKVSLYQFDWKTKHTLAEEKTSDDKGMVGFLRTSDRNYFVVAQRGEDLALDPNALNFYRPYRQPRTLGTLFFTDRSIYRPGQKVLWKALVYQGTGEKADWKVATKVPVSITLRDPNWQVVENRSVTTNEYGTASGEFNVPAGRPLGMWQLQSSANGALVVRVEEYKRPTFETKLLPAEKALRLNQPAEVTGEARYYFGLPVVAGKVAFRVTREPVYPWWWYYYEWGGAPRSGSQVVATGTATLDESGKYVIRFTPQADERLSESHKGMSYRYSVSAEVTDEGGETQTASRSFRLGFSAVEASFALDEAFLLEQRPAKITVRRTNLDGDPAPGKGRYRLLKLRAPEQAVPPADQPLFDPPGKKNPGVRTPGDLSRKRWAHNYRPEAVLRAFPDGDEVAAGDLEHDKEGKAALTLPALPAGVYRLRYLTKDDFGSDCEAERDLVVAGKSQNPPLPLWLIPEKGVVKVGEKARLLLASGLPEQKVLLEFFKDGRRTEARWVEPGKSGPVLEIPVSDADRGGFGVTATAVRDHQFMTFQVAIFVPWDDRELKLDFVTFRDKLRPGQKETWTVKVTGPAGRDKAVAAAEILAYMYDRSLDAFAPHSPQRPMGLWPNRAGIPWMRGTLGAAHVQGMECSGFAHPPAYPSLLPDRLAFLSGYGIGGMGSRHRHRALKGFGGAVRGDMDAEEEAKPEASAAVVAAAPAPAKMSREAAAEPPGDKAGLAEGKATDALTLSTEFRGGGGEAANRAPVQMRQNFAETAFFYPHLLTDADGTARIEFTVPDSVTSYQVWVHAVTRELMSGSLNKQAESLKELMVRPYLPRFLREADQASLKVAVNNAAEKDLAGTLQFDIVDPATEKSVAADFGLKPGDLAKPFSVKAKGSTTLEFPVRTPARVGTVAFKVMARAGDVGDGEIRPIPVLPGRMHLVQSRFVTLRDKARREMKFPDMQKGDDPSLIHEQLVLTLDAQLFYGVLAALPYLVNYPYECVEQTLNRFLSTGILTSLYKDYPAVERMAKEFSKKRKTRLETFDEPDPNRKMALEETPWLIQAKGGDVEDVALLNVLDPDVARAQRVSALAKLEKMQTSSGGFPWFPGGPPSPWMTLYLLHGFSKALEFGVEVPKGMVQRAWAYTHRHYLDEVLRDMRRHDCCWEFVTFINYVLSNFPDSSWSGNVFTDDERKDMLDFSFKHWKRHSPLLKGYLSLTLKRMDREKDARLVFESVMDSAKEAEDQGVFWAPEDRGWLWYNDTIESHAFALRVLMELMPENQKQDGLVMWLFLNKKLNHWKSTRATAEVIYSLAKYLQKTGALGAREEATVTFGGKARKFVFEPDQYTGKKNQVVIPGPQVDPKTCASTVVEKDSKGVMFASVTWHFSTEKLPEEGRGDYLTAERKYFKRVKSGREVTLEPLAEGAAVKVGDEVEVQISITSKHPMEYVHLRDPRGAGFEPTSQVSRHRWEYGLYWYEEIRDSGTNFFFEHLPQGQYTFRYRIRAATAGTFKVSPATLQPMYAPEFAAYSAGHVLTVQPAE
ncbi:MAG: hypothetical protein GYA21_03105 [Myxococcales bacterium]|nr:hypothetical protein [Myxococcales bacterium]